MKRIALVVTCVIALADSVFADTADDVVAWYRRYAELWNTANVDVDAVAHYYAIPSYLVDSHGVVQLIRTAEAFRSNMAASVASSKHMGWAGGKVLTVKAHVLNPGAAFVESEWTNFGADGTPLVGCQAARLTYLAAKTTDGWKFVSAHDGPCKAR
jgi:ketosteroid isomerase-like protein